MNAVGPPAVVILAANALSEHDRVGRGRLDPRLAETLAAIGLATRGYDAPPVDRQGSVSPDAARLLRVVGPPAGCRVAFRLTPRRARWVPRRRAARTDAAWDADRAPGPELAQTHDGLRPLGWRAAHPVAHPGALLGPGLPRRLYAPVRRPLSAPAGRSASEGAVPVPSDPAWYIHAIRRSRLDIYAPLEGAQAALRIPTPVLECLLAAQLGGLSFAGLPLRTRSKAAKQHVCRALGYPVPPRFKRTQPRFPGQDCNVYVHKSANLQLWNEDVARARRYVLVGLDAARAVVGVRVVPGATLLRWDTTGALTAKHQARLRLGPRPTELVTPRDTASLAPLVQGAADLDAAARPLHAPARATLWPIAHLYARMSGPIRSGGAARACAAGVSHGGGRRPVSRHPPSAGRGQAANRPHHRSGPGAAGRPGAVAGSRAGQAGRPPLRRALRPVLRAHGRPDGDLDPSVRHDRRGLPGAFPFAGPRAEPQNAGAPTPGFLVNGTRRRARPGCPAPAPAPRSARAAGRHRCAAPGRSARGPAPRRARAGGTPLRIAS